MCRPDRWLVSVVTLVCIGINVFAAWELLTPAPGDPSPGLPAIGIVAVAVSAGLAALGAFGIFEIARRGTGKWSTRMIIGTAVWWALVFVLAIAGGGLVL